MSRTVRAFAVLALMVVFLAGPAAAAPSSGVGASLWASTWQWLVDLVLPNGPLPDPQSPDPGPNGDAGGGIDPDGLTASGVILQPRGELRPAVR